MTERSHPLYSRIALIVVTLSIVCLCALMSHAEHTARTRAMLLTAALAERHLELHWQQPNTAIEELRATLSPQRVQLLHWFDAPLTAAEQVQIRSGNPVARSSLFSGTLLIFLPRPDGRVLVLSSELPSVPIVLVWGSPWLIGLLLALPLLTLRRIAQRGVGPYTGSSKTDSNCTTVSLLSSFALAVKDKVRLIRCLLESLAQDSAQAPAIHHIGQARQTLQDFDALLQDMSKLDSLPVATLTAAFDPAYVSAYVDEVVAQALAENTAQAVFLSSSVQLSANDCRFDPELTSEVIMRLISNANRHCNSRVLLSVASLNPHSVSIRVEDDGPGIPVDQWTEMLLPLSRSDSSRHRDTGRHGLGLAICKTLVECQGGSIGMRPSSLGGACVELLFGPRA